MVKFSVANAKIEALLNVEELQPYLANGLKVYSFDLLSGYSCPFANECLSKVIVNNGKRSIKDGPNTEFRCFSASQEVVYTNVYNLRKNNFDTVKSLKNTESMVDTIQSAMPKDLGICRIHVAGDMFNQDYFDAWIQIALNNPGRLFYAYTKSLQYWVNRLDLIPDNLILTASRGGRLDNLIEKYGLRSTVVVFSPEQAAELGLQIDHSDELAARPSIKNNDFALLIHGQQPKGSEASNAIKVLKKNGTKFSYAR
jgi:hypothetical protein